MSEFNGNIAQAGVTYDLYVSVGQAVAGEFVQYNFKRYNLALAMCKAAKVQGKVSFIIQM